MIVYSIFILMILKL